MEVKNSADRARFSSSGAAEIGKAVGGKTARPCDVCGRERARWYCAADEAYLCEHCDGSVHSANSVARRHERVRLGPLNKAENRSNCCYSSAFMATRRRTRSSRPHPNGNRRSAKLKDEFCSPAPVEVPVPENSPSEEFRSAVEEEEDEDLLHQVPIFMPLAEEFCVSDPTPGPAENYCNNNSRNNNDNDNGTEPRIDRATSSCLPDQNARNLDNDIDLNQFLGSEADLCEFAVDMEMDMKSIIGHGSDEALGCLGSLYPTEKYQHHLHYQRHRQTDNDNNNNNNHPDEASDSAAQKPGEWAWGRIKEEGEENTTAELASDAGCKVEPRGASDARVKVEDPDDAWDTIELNIDYNEFEEAGEGEDAEEEELEEYREPEAAPMDINLRGNRGHEDVKINLSLALDSIFGPPAPADFGYEDRKLISLRLNYEDVLTAWSGRGCPPWRLEPASDDCSSDGAGLVPDLNVPNGQAGEQVPATNNAGGHVGREARVLRYREKRRTRLFSKKIRYEVRKLNAEKRPRMKGRFVKRTSSVCCN